MKEVRMKEHQSNAGRMKMKVLKSITVLFLATCALNLSGCGGSSSDSAATVSKAVTINGSLEPGAAKLTLKSVGAVAGAIGTVVAVDAATGTVLSSTPATIVADSSGSGGTFSGLTFDPPSTQAGIILKATLSNGKTFRSIVTSDLSTSAPLTATIGPNSDVIAAAVSSSLGVTGVLGDDGVKVPTGTKLADLAAKVTLTSSAVLPKLTVGYVINTGGSAVKVPGFSILDRKTNTVTKTIRFTDGTPSVGHFANVTADGSELWLCTNKADGSAGDVNVLNTSVFGSYSTINSSNKSSFIKKSFNVGCGVQSTQTPDGKYLFTSSNQGTKGVNVFNVKNYTFLGNIPNGNTAPHVGAVSADGSKYYTTTAGSHTAVGYDISHLAHGTVPTDTNKILNVELGYGSLHAVRLHPNGKYLFVGNNTWPVPAGVTTPTSGTNVIDIATQKIITTVPGRPHNYAISPDGKYLLVTELSSPDCEVSLPGDPGNRLQFIDISTLLSASPDVTKIKDIYHFDTPGYGGSHASWDPTTGLLYYSVYDTTNQGWLYTLNTANLSAATPSVSEVVGKVKIGWAPHGVSFPGINGD
jgi:hypothetical protein